MLGKVKDLSIHCIEMPCIYVSGRNNQSFLSEIISHPTYVYQYLAALPSGYVQYISCHVVVKGSQLVADSCTTSIYALVHALLDILVNMHVQRTSIWTNKCARATRVYLD